MFTTAEEVLAFIKDEDVKFVDIRFTDLPGVQQHFNLPAASRRRRLLHRRPAVRRLLHPRLRRDPRVRHAAIPDVTTAYVDPFRKHKTLNMLLDRDPRTGEPYERDPAAGREKAEEYLASTGIADTASSPPRPSSTSSTTCATSPPSKARFYHVDSEEGAWNTGREEEGGNLGYKTRVRAGTSRSPPLDQQADLRDDITAALDRGRPRGRARPPRGRHRPARQRSTTGSTP